MIVLYGARDVPPVRKVALALALKGLTYELREPRVTEDYRRFSPETGLLPVLGIAVRGSLPPPAPHRHQSVHEGAGQIAVSGDNAEAI